MKRHNIFIYVILCFAVLLPVSCGQQHDAEQLVEAFMKENMKEPSRMVSMDFDDIDSTKHINSSAIARMREFVKGADLYKNDIKYQSGPDSKKLLILRVRYYVDNEEMCDTYYLDEKLTRVVAFKTN